jgi:surface antigen
MGLSEYVAENSISPARQLISKAGMERAMNLKNKTLNSNMNDKRAELSRRGAHSTPRKHSFAKSIKKNAFVIVASFAFLVFVGSMATSATSPATMNGANASGDVELSSNQKQTKIAITTSNGNWTSQFLPTRSMDRASRFGSPRTSITLTSPDTPVEDFAISQAQYAEDAATPVAPGNTYAPGQCTWFAYNKRIQMGLPVGTNWGNAVNWPAAAAAAGYDVDHNPEIGDIFEGLGISAYGHVAIVREVGPFNTVLIMEMNYGGPFQFNERWVSNATNYTYIH